MPTAKDNEIADASFLNIKQAAKLLNVSEISLRRWSDAGKLPCLRVGVRRERRFRMRDLINYLEQNPQNKNTRTIDPSVPATGRVAYFNLEGISIHYGSHLCAFYDSDPGRLKLALPFLLNGLKTGNRCFLVASDMVQTIMLQELRDVRPAIDRDIDDGNLVIIEGISNGCELYAFFEDAFLKAGKQGIQGIQVLGDMAWILQKNMAISELVDFEARYNQGLGRRFPVISLCQYDARLFSGTAILNVLKCHEDTFQYPLSRFLGA